MEKFFKSHKMSLALLIALMAVGLFAGCTSNTSDNSTGSTVGTALNPSDPRATTVPTTGTVEPNIGNTTNPSTEPSTEIPTTQPTTTSTPETNPPTTPPATQPPATEPPKTTTPPATEPPMQPGVYVGPADPETGLSWDGVSPIIYTYPDGTTGTVPKEGATYERRPGVKSTYTGYVVGSNATGSVNGVFYCEDCGKVCGDGSKGTCVYWLTAGDHTCSCCGDTVPGGVCHTCDED